MLGWFRWYGRRYLAKHFHSVRVSQSGADVTSIKGPVVIYLNHASWWDPMVCLSLSSRLFAERSSYAPIDAKALNKYRFFRHLGFFGVEQGTARGAVHFLRTASCVLAEPNAVLWLTPQGRFADVRERPLGFRDGLAALARREPQATFLPLAIEYSFWEERLPEVLARFAEPVSLSGDPNDAERLERALELNLASLAVESIRRHPADFTCVIRRRTGVAPAYDLWRKLSAWSRGHTLNLQHGIK